VCVNNLSKVELDSAAAGIEPAISSHESNALTTTPPSRNIVRHTLRRSAVSRESHESVWSRAVSCLVATDVVGVVISSLC